MIIFVESRKNGETLFTFIGKIVPDSCESRREKLGIIFASLEEVEETLPYPSWFASFILVPGIVILALYLSKMKILCTREH